MNPPLSPVREEVSIQATLQVGIFVVLSSAILAVFRTFYPFSSFSVFTNTTALISVGLFILGSILGLVLISTAPRWIRQLLQRIPWELVNDASAVATLRSPVMLLVIPILGILLLMSNSASLGLGAFWGVWSWYAHQVLQILTGNPSLTQQYFPFLPAGVTDQFYRSLLFGFLFFGVFWAGVLGFLTLM